MKSFKSLLSGCIAVICLFFLVSAAEAADRLQILTTIFPEYDWVLNILGENPAGAEVTQMLDSGVDLHSYQPTVSDILKLSTCSMFIYVGGESDDWVKDALQGAVNKDMIVINLLDVLGDAVKEEELVEGMETEHDHDHEDNDHDHEGKDHDHEDEDEDLDHDHDHEHEDEDHEHEEIEYDEHVWLSLRNAAVLCENIAEALCRLDSENAAVYQANAADYIQKLNALDAKYQALVSEAPVHTLVFGDRFPFRYLTDDYGLDYYAAFSGCSAETEASFETIIFLTQKINELGLNSVMTIEGKDHRIAQTIVQNTESKNQQILTLDSMQGSTSKDHANGKSYLSIMEENLEVLKEALK